MLIYCLIFLYKRLAMEAGLNLKSWLHMTQWSYMTIIFRIFDVVWGILREGIRIDGVII